MKNKKFVLQSIFFTLGLFVFFIIGFLSVIFFNQFFLKILMIFFLYSFSIILINWWNKKRVKIFWKIVFFMSLSFLFGYISFWSIASAQ